MNYTNKNYEISFKRMFYYVCYRWKKILIAAVALAIIFGGVKGFSTLKKAHNLDILAEYEQSYNDSLKEYELQKQTLEQDISKLQHDIEMQQEYLDQSILMEMDSHSVYVAEASFYIDTNYQIKPDLSYQNMDTSALILASYQTSLRYHQVMEQIAGLLKVDPRYVKELVSISGQLNHILNITVCYADQQTAQDIMDVLLEQMDRIHSNLTASIGEHSVKTLGRSVSVSVDADIASRQETEHRRLADYQEEQSQLLSELEELEAPVLQTVSNSDVVKAGVKWAVAGGIVGVIISVAVGLVAFVTSDRLYSGDELRDRFNIRILGSIWGGQKPCRGIFRAIRKAEGRIAEQSQINAELIAARFSGDRVLQRTVLVTGGAQADQVEKLTEKLKSSCTGIQFVNAGSLLTSAQALLALPDCDGVLLVEQCGKSTYRNIAAEIDQIGDAGKTLMGCVIVEQ